MKAWQKAEALRDQAEFLRNEARGLKGIQYQDARQEYRSKANRLLKDAKELDKYPGNEVEVEQYL